MANGEYEDYWRYEPGAFLCPWTGYAGSYDQSGYNANDDPRSGVATNWAIASLGVVTYGQHIPYNAFSVDHSNTGPLGTCQFSGWKAPLSTMVNVDGSLYLPEFAPISRSQRWQRR